MSDLQLPGAIPGLLRRGAPVHHQGGAYVVVADPDVLTVCIGNNDEGVNRDLAELTLDLTDPLGRECALLWLRERKHYCEWMREHKHAARLIAWSVLSVAGGSYVISGVRQCGADRLQGTLYLAAGYALENDDSTLTLPELTRG